ncbi:hypothetical protein THAOC_18627 [Thalassiosira oceanica]|uniref:Protein farnesyltransferase/geranylgeranyltransferase type-1 subunit alpha n=1 Tax=Thalassiosira oceanica TaxID=159749 RepID=K0SRJ4_THAOC|nr:hypothetical protein THAOC_18627 [Thalassiosira oceanica]|mmetsp:Transcript_4632/g.10389  ORF Transcript_4632/g.10389 Transcript_4632/m.10389 type:complete len:357 (+) Transcript_4632:81-1151(+)|eukprot:EJK60952.1 hypothetical protein THAOC_18627 [Thalassiosira oceanica]
METADFASFDVEPISQDDGPDPVCSIAYTPAFTQAHDYFRAFLKTDERSERAFDVTTRCLEFNAANYTVWAFRRRCLVALSKMPSSSCGEPTIDSERIESDLQFADALGGSNPKNYQIWYHRRALLEFRFKTVKPDMDVLSIATKELDYVDRVLCDDSKNYHAWSHRQWILRTINNPQLWTDESKYAHTMVLKDPRNNSAWNQRYFALHRGSSIVLSTDEADEEINYAIDCAKLDPYNESPWRYLMGLVTEQWRHANESGDPEKLSNATELANEAIARTKETQKILNEMLVDNKPTGPCANLLSALADLLELFLTDRQSLKEANEILSQLITADPVRRKYWKSRVEKNERALAALR